MKLKQMAWSRPALERRSLPLTHAKGVETAAEQRSNIIKPAHVDPTLFDLSCTWSSIQPHDSIFLRIRIRATTVMMGPSGRMSGLTNPTLLTPSQMTRLPLFPVWVARLLMRNTFGFLNRSSSADYRVLNRAATSTQNTRVGLNFWKSNQHHALHDRRTVPR